MKLLGRDIPARELISRIEERLRTRGLPTSEPVEVPAEGVEPRVEPLTFNLHALEENADATRSLPLHTHRGGAGQLVLVAKWAFRKSCQVFINEALGRQRVFNGHVRDSYAQLSAEVIRLRREVEDLRARGGGRPPEDDRRPIPAKTSSMATPVAEREPRPSASAAAPSRPPVGSGTAPSGRAVSPSKPPVGSGTAPSASAAAPSKALAGSGSAPATRTVSPAKQPVGSGSAPATRTVSPSTPPVGSSAGSTKGPSQAKRTAHRKPASEVGSAATSTGGEPVIPRPRNTRAEEGQTSRTQETASRARPEAPTAGKTGPRARKPGAQRRGRRK